MVRLPRTAMLCSLAVSALLTLTASSANAQSSANLRIMPVGDSITAGFRSVNNNGYRDDLSNALKSQVQYLDFVGTQRDGTMSDPDNEGHYGYRIDQIAGLITGALNTYKPNIATVMIGINDLGQKYQIPTAPDRLASLVDQMLAAEPDATILLSQLIINSNTFQQTEVVTFNNALPGIVNARANAGKHVYLVDMSALTLADLADGLHPNATGDQKISDAFDAAIQTVIGKGWIHDPIAGSATRPSGSAYSGIAGKCLDGGSLVSGGKVALSSCTGAPGQNWNFNNGAVVSNDVCMQVAGSGTANKTLVNLANCSGNSNQIWTVEANGTLVNPASGRCLDDPGGSTTNGTQLEIYDCNSGSNQQWLAPSQGFVTSGISGKCLDDKAGSPNSGTHVDSYACNNNPSQQWSIYNHLLKFDGKCVSVVGGGTGNGSLVDIETCTGASSQTWTPVNGTLVNSGSGRCLDIPGSSASNGIQLDIEDCSGGSNQKWTLPNL